MRVQDSHLQDHPWRAAVLVEVHARPFAALGTPCRVLHFAFSTDEDAASAARAGFEALCTAHGVQGPAADAKHHLVEFSGSSLRWEMHSEFTTYSWQFPVAADARPFLPSPDSLADVMALVPQPGPLLVAVDLHLLPDAAAEDGLGHAFGPVTLAVASVEDGAARIATDFRPDPHGYVRILVLDRSLTGSQAGGLVARALEIETYRSFALLGLLEAQRQTPSVRRIETELPVLLEQIQASGEEANRLVLDQLLALAAELESGAAASLYRFGATRAYADLVRLRLATIGEQPVPGAPSWSAFLSHRMEPAIRTCAVMEVRQANLSTKLARAAQLLRTRVEIELQSQNRDLLRGVHDRARQQLRLQQTVEGLSVAAISYYIVSLIHTLIEGARASGSPVDPTVATALAVPVVLAGVAWLVRRIRRRSHGPT